MEIFQNITSLKTYLSKLDNKKIGLVPTMGALHQGHLSLIKKIKEHCDIVVVSIFVNQRQFNENQDYLSYPQDFKSDIDKLCLENVDIIFKPDPKEIYNDSFAVSISVGKLTEGLCGYNRVGHFDGVALIVTKLFNIVNPHIAIFGEKDFQQLQIIKKLVCDLNIDVKIISGKIIRQESGLAMSSRNLKIDSNQKLITSEIYQNLLWIKKQILEASLGELQLILFKAKKNLLELGFNKIDYLEVCDEETLQPLEKFDQMIKARIFIACYLGSVRLIDNLEIN